MSTALFQVPDPMGSRPFSVFLKGSRDSREAISNEGEHTGLLYFARSRP